MWRVNLVLIAAAACFITTCHGASLAEAAQKDQRFLGTMNQYYIMTWDLLGTEREDELVPNTQDGMAGLDFLSRVVSDKNSLIRADQSMAVILVDWNLVSMNYNMAVAAVPSVAEDLIKFINLMESAQKLNRNQLHLIGFDLGAHVVGITSRNSLARARKITALDPAGQGWDRYSPRLRSTDAQFVEVIHTDGVGARAYGIGEPIGDLDFFPNGGTRQPGCPASDNLCHHNRAWELFAATVDENGHLRGLSCESMAQVNNNRCVGGPYEVMGSLALAKLGRGIYRVNTGRTWPYIA